MFNFSSEATGRVGESDLSGAVVAMAMEWVPSYRVPFYNQLRSVLHARGIELRLVHGDPPGNRKERKDHMTLPWAESVPNEFFSVKGTELTHQPVWGRVRDVDFLVLQQEVGLSLNYRALWHHKVPGFHGPPVGLWGHGENPNPQTVNRWAEKLKRRVTPSADWFFAYTERSAARFRHMGVPNDRITVVQNSTDTEGLCNPTSPPSEPLGRRLAEVGERGARVGWVVSALDEWKRVPFLLEVLDKTRTLEPQFEFFVLGAGNAAHILESAAVDRPWLHVLGPTFGADKAAVGQLAEVMIHPGLAGLHVVESFATSSPMVTADLSYHSHEIDYLRPGENAVVLPASAPSDAFAHTIADLFAYPDRLAQLQAGCSHDAERYSLDQMVRRFAYGIEQALEVTAQ